MSHKLREQLKNLKKEEGLYQADPSWVANNKKALFSRIENTGAVEQKETKSHQNYFTYFVRSFSSSQLSLAARPVLTLFLVVAMTGGGWMASVSAANSLPGDLLYSVKRAVENVQMAVASSEKKPSIHLSLARKRSEEVGKVLKKNKPKAKELVKKSLKDMRENLESATEGVKETQEKTTKVKVVKEMIDTKNEITENLEAQVSLEDADLDLKNDFAGVVEDAGDMVIDSAQDLLTEESVEEDEELDSQLEEEVKEIVEDVVEKVIADAEELINENDDTKALVEGIEKKITEGGSAESSDNVIEDSQLDTLIEIATGTQMIGADISESTDTADNTDDTGNTDPTDTSETSESAEEIAGEVVKKVDEASESVEEKTEEVKDLLESEDLSGAIKKAKELSEATQESKKVATGVKEIAEEVGVTEEVEEVTSKNRTEQVTPE